MRRVSRLRSFVRARLRRRLFAWFTLTIVATALVVAAVVAAGLRSESGGVASSERLASLAAELFARDWDDATARATFADRVALALGGGVEVRSADERLLHLAGTPCGSPSRRIVVHRDGARLGTVTLCPAHPPRRTGWLLGLVATLAMLWTASGLVARRLARPLDELSDVVRRIGKGELSARATLGCRAPDELGSVAGAVNDMASRLEAQVNEQRELVATVSHELRTPIARLRLLTELLRANASPERLDAIDAELHELDELVGGLLAQSRADLGLVRLGVVSARELASRAVERAGLPPEMVEVRGDEPDALHADGSLLLRALANLLENARLHGGGARRLAVILDSGSVTFEVLDEGAGPPVGVDPFGKFERGSQGFETGLGLGLALVRAAAAAHGGEAWLRRRDDGGATAGFWVNR